MTESATQSVQAGPYVVGEKPPPLQYTFLDSTSSPIDLSGYTAKFDIREKDGAPSTYNATVLNPSGGVVQYTWTGVEFPTSGSYLSELWVGNGVVRYASILIKFDVRTAVGPVPSV
jgi:hypothetical protein